MHGTHQPGVLGMFAGVIGQDSRYMCQGGKPGTGKLDDCVCLCGSTHDNGCMVNGYGCIFTIIRYRQSVFLCYVAVAHLEMMEIH